MNAPRTLGLLLLVVLFAALAAASLSFAADARPAVSPDFGAEDTHRPPAGTPAPPALLECPDLYEPNQTFATAWEIPLTTYIAYRYGHVYSYVCESDSSDFWKFYVTAGQQIQLDVSSLPGPAGLYLYNPDGQIRWMGPDQGGSIHSVYVAGSTGWWRADLECWTYSNDDPYHLEVRVFQPTPTATPTATATPTCPDTYEDNDHAPIAIPLTSGYGHVYSYMCYGDSIDYWEFNATAGDRIQLDLTSVPINLDMNLGAPDEIGPRAISNTGGWQEPEHVIYTADITGKWLITIYRGFPLEASSNDDSYHLEVRVSSGTATPTRTSTRTATRTRTPTVTPTRQTPLRKAYMPVIMKQGAPVCEDKIKNGGFDTGTFAYWATSGSPQVTSSLWHTGGYSAILGAAANDDSSVYQGITLPAGASSATLTFWRFIYTQDEMTNPWDYLKVEARDSGGTVLATLLTLDNRNAGPSWVKSTVDLMAYPALFGKTIRLAFHATNDVALPTSFYIDDVKLEVCGP